MNRIHLLLLFVKTLQLWRCGGLFRATFPVLIVPTHIFAHDAFMQQLFIIASGVLAVLQHPVQSLLARHTQLSFNTSTQLQHR